VTVRTLAVVSAGLREPSSTRLLADRLAAATVAALDQEVVVEVVELREHGHDLVNNLLTGFPSGALRAAVDTVAKADGLIVVTPIFNASYSGLFKMFFDVLDAGSLVGKPVLVAATGGTARHSLALEHALRPLFAYLRSIVVPTAVFAASEDWSSAELSGRIDRGAAELAGLIAGRPNEAPVDPFEDPTPFEQLLTRG
jgi:FMN reductase